MLWRMRPLGRFRHDKRLSGGDCARRTALPTPHKNGPNRFLCAPMRRQSRRLAGAAVRTAASRHIKPPAGEVPERSEGGGEAKEGESGRAR